MKIEFSGAALGVTGSKHLFHINGKKILLDCGLFQGRRQESLERNIQFPFEASEINSVVLSHAHIDHSGALPLLIKRGFTGNIYATHATRDLCAIMLRDSAYIHEKDAEFWTKKTGEQHDPLYNIDDAEKCLAHFRSVDYDQPFFPERGIRVTFHDAGHLLGSAIEEWEFVDQETQQPMRIGFTGDLGRKNLPILRDQEFLSDLDVLLTESTYGDRLHDEVSDIEAMFFAKINETVARGGKVIIPAFSVGRTQEVIYMLKKGQHEKIIPHTPIFVDSPLSRAATEIFGLHSKDLDAETQKLFAAGGDPFMDNVQFTESVEDSKALNNFPGPAIIIASSGMCEFGRIRHHLYNGLPNAQNTVLIVGFMAENTLGRKLVDGEKTVKIFRDIIPVRAEVVIYNAFSGHADQSGLLGFAAQAGNLKNIFCVHGESKQIEPFTHKLQEVQPNAEIFVPAPGEIFELGAKKQFHKTEETNPISAGLFRPK